MNLIYQDNERRWTGICPVKSLEEATAKMVEFCEEQTESYLENLEPDFYVLSRDRDFPGLWRFVPQTRVWEEV